MDKFIKEVNKYSITLDCQREIDSKNKTQRVTYDLIYEINEYELLSNQDKKYIKRLRKNKFIIKPFKEKKDGKIQVYYYKLYSHRRMSKTYIEKRINSILNKEIVCNGQVFTNDMFIQDQINKRVHKTKKMKLISDYEEILHTIASYFDQIYSDYNVKEHRNELSLEYIRGKRKYKKMNRYEKHKIKKEKHEKWLKRHNAQIKRWNKSKTIKQNEIYHDILPANYWESLGFFDPNKKNISEWSLVNSDNFFYFNGNKYLISDKLLQYKVYQDNKTQMEKVLCYYLPYEDKYYFYDENIENINKFINKVS